MEYKEFPNAYFSGNRDMTLPTPKQMDGTIYPFRRHLVDFIKSLPVNARILDAGCGSGKASFMVKIYRPDITIHAVDISDVSDLLSDWIKFKKGSVDDVDQMYPSEYFDAIICLHVIEHLIFPIKMMNAFRAVLKNGGQVFFETPNWTRLFIPFSPMFFWNDYTHIRPFSPFAMNKLLIESGFSPKLIKSRSSNLLFVKGDDRIYSKIRKVSEERPKIYSVKEKSRIIELSKAVFRRLTNPFMKDVLIAVARKSE